SDNGTDVSSLYSGDVSGTPLTKNSLVVSIPGGAPTGQVFNSTQDFAVSNGTTSAPALFIFASENGQITAWNPGLTPITAAVNGVTVAGAVFKGLALASNAQGNFLFAADFHGGTIDVFDKN